MGVMVHRSSRAFCMLRHVREVFPCRILRRHSSGFNDAERDSPRSVIGDVKTKEHKSSKESSSQTHSDPREGKRLKFCVVGSGPAGFYTAEKLVKRYNNATVDILERLPSPFGLVRSGVAPDHPETKNVINQFSRAAAQQQCNFFGNVELGRDVKLTQLQPLYHAVVLAYGAEGDRLLNIPGEELQGVIAGREFVWWYNGHPEYKDFLVDLTSSDTAIILGQGNVALDIARILLRRVEELKSTDIARHALSALAESRIRRVLIVGRRGPVQAACTARELRELLGVEGVEVSVREGELETTPTDLVEMKKNRGHKRVYDLFTQAPKEGVDGRSSSEKQINFRFFRNPVELYPATNDSQRVGSVRFEKTVLRVVKGSSRQQVAGTGSFENLDAGIVFRSIGYKSLPRPVQGLPFDHMEGIIPNVVGRVESCDGSILAGVYVVGWLKRGPSGVIGTNLTDAEETVSSIQTDLETRFIRVVPKIGTEGLKALLLERKVEWVDWEGWRRIDAEEVRLGALVNKPREKIVDKLNMLKISRACPFATDPHSINE